MNNDNEEIQLPEGSEKFTDAQREELRAAMMESRAAQREIEKSGKELRRAEVELTKACRDSELREAIGGRFHNADDALKLIGKNVFWDTDARAFVVKDNPNSLPKLNSNFEPMTVAEYVEQFAIERPYMVRATQNSSTGLPTHSTQNEFANVTSKADLKGDPKLISRYVDLFGLLKFESLKLK